MSRPPLFAPRPLPKPRLFRRVPPMVFPPVLGALLLGLGWRDGAALFGLPEGFAEAFLGALVLLWIFTHAAYVAKIARRPAVLREDLALLPGRVGLGAAVMSDYAAALAISPYAPDLARAILCVALLLHALLIIMAIRGMRAGPTEARDVTPAWHLLFAGPMLGALAALDLGWPELARGLFVATAPVAVGIWVASLRQLIVRIPPAPLRPMLALHLGQAALLGVVAHGLGWPTIAFGCAILGAGMLVGLLAAGHWIVISGYTAFWGVVPFPLSGVALLMLAFPEFSQAGGVMLVVATLVSLPIIARVLQDWSRGRLSATTNAAEA